MRELPHHSSHLLVRFCGCSTIVAGHSASLPPPASLHYVLSVDTCSASKPASRCHAGAEETKCEHFQGLWNATHAALWLHSDMPTAACQRQ